MLLCCILICCCLKELSTKFMILPRAHARYIQYLYLILDLYLLSVTAIQQWERVVGTTSLESFAQSPRIICKSPRIICKYP